MSDDGTANEIYTIPFAKCRILHACVGALSTDQRSCCRDAELGQVHACPGLCDLSKRETTSLSALAGLVDGRLSSWNDGAALKFRGGQSADLTQRTGCCRPIAAVLGYGPRLIAASWIDCCQELGRTRSLITVYRALTGKPPSGASPTWWDTCSVSSAS